MDRNISNELIRIVEASASKFKKLDDKAVKVKPNPEKWSIQEILGHLIDSAANNHQRFVRAQQADNLIFPAYNQDVWVELQEYNEQPWPELVELWRLFNLHLARVIARIPPEKMSVECKIGHLGIVTLGYLIKDYLRHLKHHLKQIEERISQ